MRITARVIVFAIVGALGACTAPSQQPPAPDPAAGPATEASTAALTAPAAELAGDEAPAYTVRAEIAPTEAMLKAALANDPDAMRDAVATQTVCQATSTCPAQYGSCSGWSSTTLCSSTCGPGVCLCKPIRLCEGEPPEPKGTDTYNSFRVCFDPAQHACTEWLNTSATICGC